MSERVPGGGASTRPIRVIFVCTGNSARSQMAEAILRHEGGDRFEVVSAGTEPAAGVHPMTVRVLASAGLDISGARAKATTEFIGRPWDYVITVCDRARQACPYFPGGHETLHWGLDDPAEVAGDDAHRLAAFERVLREVSSRVHAFIPLARATHG
jgi:arsenate reductase